MQPLDTMTENYYALPAAGHLPVWKRGGSVMLVVGGHVLIAVLLVHAAMQPEFQQPLRALSVRLLEAAVPKQPHLEMPKPAFPQLEKKKIMAPPPVIAAVAKSESTHSFTVAPQPEQPAVPVHVAVSAPAPLIAARFDADYLQNPKPAYPPMSRRLGEEGKVVLRVRVSAKGLPVSIEISKSSGFSRLDEAACGAVEHWRFVPATQGVEAVESTVLVPLNFTLHN